MELAWLGWPVVHNAHLCKDVGYYYEGFNYEQGGQVLHDALLKHDFDLSYIERNRANIDRFLPTNLELQRQYEGLLTKLLGSRHKSP